MKLNVNITLAIYTKFIKLLNGNNFSFKLIFLFSSHNLTIHYRHHRTKKRRHNRRRNHRRRIRTSILASISNNIHWYQLQRRNIHHKKCAHLIACSPRTIIGQTPQRTCHFSLVHIFLVSPLPLQLLQVAHCPKPPLESR